MPSESAASTTTPTKGPTMRMRLIRFFGTILAGILLVGGLVRADVPPPPVWNSTLERDHPLVGKLWTTDRRLFLPLESIAREIVMGDFVLLGEVHDNPDHHRLRAWIIEAGIRLRQAGSGRAPPAAVFEHIRVDQSVALASFAALPATVRTAASLLERLEWAKSGWPDQSRFEPLFAAVLEAGLPIAAGDAPRATIRQVARGEAGAPPAPEPPLSAPLQDALLSELEASHCGLMPKTAFTRMADAQRYRDDHLAERLAAAAATAGAAVLFAGNGHVRSDRGVPFYLKPRVAARRIVTVMLLEVESGRTDPGSYVPLAPDGTPAVDFIVFTPRTERPDPCDEMRAMMAARKKP